MANSVDKTASENSTELIIGKYPIESVIHPQGHNFENISQSIIDLNQLFVALKIKLDSKEIPQTIVNFFNQKIALFEKSIEDMVHIRIPQNISGGQWQEQKRLEIQTLFNDVFTEQANNFSRQIKRNLALISVFSDLNSEVKNTRNLIKNIEEMNEKSVKVVEAMQEASSKVGVSKFTAVFENQARSNFLTAIFWFVLALISIVIFGLFLYRIFTDFQNAIKPGIDFSIAIQILLSKLFLISFFSILLYQFFKSYNANMHLYALNKHRENCLKTFQTFVEGAKDPKIVDTILLQATKAIFESGETGFVSSKDSGSSTGIEITKIFDQVGRTHS